jgi:hypothetical protein
LRNLRFALISLSKSGGCGQGTSITSTYIVGSISTIDVDHQNEIVMTLTPTRAFRYTYSHYWSSGKGAEYSRRETDIEKEGVNEKYTLRIPRKNSGGDGQCRLTGKTQLAWPNDLNFFFSRRETTNVYNRSIFQLCKEMEIEVTELYRNHLAKFSDPSQDRLATEDF